MTTPFTAKNRVDDLRLKDKLPELRAYFVELASVIETTGFDLRDMQDDRTFMEYARLVKGIPHHVISLVGRINGCMENPPFWISARGLEIRAPHGCLSCESLAETTQWWIDFIDRQIERHAE